MRVDKGVALVVYREAGKKEEFLVLKRYKNWTGWELPKGHMEHGSHVGTVFLELNEEAGIEPVDVEEIVETENHLTFSYDYEGEEVVSDFKCFTVRVSANAEVDLSSNPSDEHADYRWLAKDEALQLLEYEDQKELLSKNY